MTNAPKLESLKKECLFCDPKHHGQEDQVLLRSDNFYLFAGLGAIKDGYIIIAPYACEERSLRIRSLSEVPAEWMDELAYLRLLIAEFYRGYYSEEMLTFEHGRAGTCLVTKGDTKHCYHAHLCCYPFEPVVPKDLKSENEANTSTGAPPLWEDISGNPAKPIKDLHELPEKVGDSAYLLFESIYVDYSKKAGAANREQWHHRVLMLSDDHKLESQYLRRLLANRIGKPELWNWLEYPQIQSAKNTKINFHQFLKENSEKYRVYWNGKKPHITFLDSVVSSNVKGNDAVAEEFAHLWGNRLQHEALGGFFKYLKKTSRADKKPKKVLDGGCGPANYSQVFYHQGYECVGIDTSTEMLAIAQGVIDALDDHPGFSQKPPRPKLLCHNALDPDFPEEYFDGIWYSAIIVHVPRIHLPYLLSKLNSILIPEGVLYLSAQLDGGTNQRVTLRTEGRVFFYYDSTELRVALREAGFEIIKEWQDEANIGSKGDTNTKIWRQFILRKLAAPALDISHEFPITRLDQLGEASIHQRILSMLPSDAEDWINLAPGDDCAAIDVPKDETLVISTDPCPIPVLSMLEEDNDPYRFGWFSMIIGLSDIAAMGARPLGMLLALEAEESMSIDALDEFYAGALEASREFNCPILGGNVKDGKGFHCVGTALGSVSPEFMLRRAAARTNQRLLVLGEMGRFWAGVLCKVEGIELDSESLRRLMVPLQRPMPRVREGRALVEGNLSQCAMDSSDGLTACFREIAEQSKVDLNIDLEQLIPPPEVAEVALKAGIDPRKMMLGWGDWQLVCTTSNEQTDSIHTTMQKLGCPVTEVGWVSEGEGRVWVHDHHGLLGMLEDFASTRFSKASYFTHGIEEYIHQLRNKPIYTEKGDSK